MKSAKLAALSLVIVVFSILLSSNSLLAQAGSDFEFTYFKGQYEPTKGVELSWKVVNFLEVTEFAVLRSADGSMFERVTTLAPNDNGVFNVWDVSPPLNGMVHYKIHAVGLKEFKAESKVLCIDTSPVNVAPDIRVYPNPVSTNLFMEIGPKENVLRVSIKDSQGGTVVARDTKSGNGRKIVFKHDMTRQPNGMYFVIFELGGTATGQIHSECVLKR